MANIRMYVSPWCGDCSNAKRFLDERGLAYETVNIDEQPAAADLIVEKNQGKRKVPTFEVDGRWFAASLFDPDQLAQDLGLDA